MRRDALYKRQALARPSAPSICAVHLILVRPDAAPAVHQGSVKFLAAEVGGLDSIRSLRRIAQRLLYILRFEVGE